MPLATLKLRERKSLHPHRRLLITNDVKLDYSGFYDRVQLLRERLTGQGIAPGDVVAITGESFETVFLGLFANWELGSIPAVIPRYDSQKALESLNPVGLITDPNTVMAFRDGRTDAENSLILFTSGSTGQPKGVVLKADAIVQNAVAASSEFKLDESDRLFINTSPLYTSAICHFLSVLVSGGTLIAKKGLILPEILKRELEECGATSFGGAPVHYQRVVGHSDAKLPQTLRRWISSGEALLKPLIEAGQKRFPRLDLHCVYGLTEVSGRLAALSPSLLATKPGSVGKTLGNMTITIRNEAGEKCPVGEIGEIFVQGSWLFKEYLDCPEETAAVKTDLGFRTGDFGSLDRNGDLWIEGRRDEVIKSGAEKVSLRRVREAVLKSIDCVDLAVIDGWDEVIGRVPCAFIVLRGGEKMISPELMRAVRADLPATHVPKRWYVVDLIPRTGSGKVLVGELRKQVLNDTAG